MPFEVRCQNHRVASKGLTECWRAAMAAKPSTWKLMGVACGPGEVDPKIHSAAEWCARARGPNKERLEDAYGHGDQLLASTRSSTDACHASGTR